MCGVCGQLRGVTVEQNNTDYEAYDGGKIVADGTIVQLADLQLADGTIVQC